MEFIDKQRVNENLKLVNEALPKMSELARTIVEDGLKISAKEIYLISVGKLSLNLVYTSEAKNRVKDAPKYVIDENVNLAASRANKHYAIVNEVRKGAGILAKLKPESFQMSNEYSISYVGELEKDLTALFTKKLSPKQIELVESIKAFRDSLTKFNDTLEEASLHSSKINIKIPLTDHLGEVNLKKISFVDFEEIESKKQQLIQAGIREKELRAIQEKRLQKLIPSDYPNRDEELKKWVAWDPKGKNSDHFYLKMFNPTEFQKILDQKEKQKARLEKIYPKHYPNRDEEIQKYVESEINGKKYPDSHHKKNVADFNNRTIVVR